MTADGYKKMVEETIPQAEEKLKDRKLFLQKWAADEYKEAVEKLDQWDQELIQNTNHQQDSVGVIESYGQLLLAVGEYNRASKYCETKIKQTELDRAVEGFQWRRSGCLIRK